MIGERYCISRKRKLYKGSTSRAQLAVRLSNVSKRTGSCPSRASLAQRICLGWTSPSLGYGRICPHNNFFLLYIYIYIYIYIFSYFFLLMCLNQRGDISTLKGGSLKLVDKFANFGSSVSSTENAWLVKAWTAIDRLSVIWKSDLPDKIKCNFVPAAVVSILLYGCTTWMLTKRVEKKLDGNRTRILWTKLNKSLR